ncbi:MAG: hypothetical protein KIT20_14660, partial [Alphaproteobacteria bacterium]|nr:hypothetical protein [Alphaproteobacteria bacterium]
MPCRVPSPTTSGRSIAPRWRASSACAFIARSSRRSSTSTLFSGNTRVSIQPDFQTFAEGYDEGRPQVVWTTLVADLETPVSAMLKLADGRPMSFLLESVEGGAVRGRYSIIGMRPDLIWRCRRGRAEINRNARYAQEFAPCEQDPLTALRALLKESEIGLPRHLPPMAAGIVGYMTYDMVRLVENIPDNKPDPLGIPDALFVRPTVMAIFDSILDVVTVVTPVRPERGRDARAAYALANERLADVVADFERTLPYGRERLEDAETLPEPVS